MTIHSGIGLCTQATISCSNMMDGGNGLGLSLSLSVSGIAAEISTWQIRSWMDSVNYWIISSFNWSVCQLTGTWRSRPLLTSFCLACFDIGIARLTVIVKGMLRVVAARFGVAPMHFDCIFMWQKCKIKDEWITQHIRTNKQIWKNVWIS